MELKDRMPFLEHTGLKQMTMKQDKSDENKTSNVHSKEFSKLFSFDNKINKEDILFGKAIIDNTSLDIISGSIIDFKKEMIGESFVINNPKASSSCGCGLSFSV